MPPSSQPRFTFQVSSLPRDAFHVVRFTGQEALSTFYIFDIVLLAPGGAVEMSKALEGDACLTVHAESGQGVSWRGVLREFHRLQRVDGGVFCRAVLVPRAYALSLSQQSRAFLDRQVPQVLRECLTGAGLAQNHDFEFATVAPYAKREFICQYEETDFAFASRWMERNGLYFYFDHSGPREKLRVTDTLNAHKPHPEGRELLFREVSGLPPGETGRACSRLNQEIRRLPGHVEVRDYNYRTPGVAIEHQAEVAPSGRGVQRLYGGNIRSTKEAQYLANTRAQALRCREQLAFGESDAPFVQPGWIVTLRDHFQDDCNQAWLPLEVRHEGSQEQWLAAGHGLKGLGDRLFYRNSFSAIPARTQYRSLVKTARPRIAGTLHAFVDAEGSGGHAELDDQGRYKVVLPFDLSGRQGGHASAWLRMMQPYAGPGHGMHFPLHKGTEVALVFEEGDPDRPVIAGAVPNPLTRSVVTAANQTKSVITSASGNHIHMEDLAGSERILMHCPSGGGHFVRVGAPNDPPTDGTFTISNVTTGSDGKISSVSGAWSAPPASLVTPESQRTFDTLTTKGITLASSDALTVKCQVQNLLTLGAYTATTVGATETNFLGGKASVTVALSSDIKCVAHYDFVPGNHDLREKTRLAAAKKEAVVGSLVDMVGDATSVRKAVREVADDATTFCVRRSELASAEKRIKGSVEDTYATKDELASKQSQTIAECKRTIAEETATAASVNNLVAELNNVYKTVEEIFDTQTRQYNLMSEMAGSIAKLAGDITLAAESIDAF